MTRAARPVLWATSAAIIAGIAACVSLPPNAAAHPLADADDLMLADAEHLGDDDLNLGRILRRRVDDHLALLAGIGDRGLRFEIKLLLAAAVEHAAQPVRRRCESPRRRRRGRCAARADEAARSSIDSLDRENRLGCASRRSCIGLRGRSNAPRAIRPRSTTTGWPTYSTSPSASTGSSLNDGAEHVVARNVGGRVDADDAGNRRGAASSSIDSDLPAGDRAADEADQQLVRPQRQVVDDTGPCRSRGRRPSRAEWFCRRWS